MSIKAKVSSPILTATNLSPVELADQLAQAGLKMVHRPKELTLLKKPFVVNTEKMASNLIKKTASQLKPKVNTAQSMINAYYNMQVAVDACAFPTALSHAEITEAMAEGKIFN